MDLERVLIDIILEVGVLLPIGILLRGQLDPHTQYRGTSLNFASANPTQFGSVRRG